MTACPETWNAERTALAVEVLHRSGFLRLRLRGESMLPTLWPGDEVEIASCSRSDLKRGHIALAFSNARFVLHRVFRIPSTGEVITRGDAMPGPDSPFPADAIVGRVVQVTRRGLRFSISRRFTPWQRVVGILLCYSSLARGIALRIHQRRIELAHASAASNLHEPLQIRETQQAASLHGRLVSPR